MMLTYPKPLHYLKPFPKEELEKVSRISWLSRIGRIEGVEGVSAVLDRGEAIAMAMSDDWAAFKLEMRNEVTGFLASRHAQNYTEWNNSARALKGFFDAQVAPMIAVNISEMGLREDLIRVIGWDVITALQEIAFSHFRLPRFHHRLLAIYKAGHLPCGICPLDLDYPKPDGTIQYH